MSDLRKRNRAANLALNHVLNSLGILIESRSTSASGGWVTCIGSRHKGGLPSWCVVNFRLVDGHVDFHEWSTADSPEVDYETAKRQAYTTAREFYESVALALKTAGQGQSEESDEQSGMEVINPDGTKTEWVN